MQVVLIQPEHELQKNPPLGLLYIASYLEANGHDVHVLDLGVEKKDPVKFVNSIEPDAIGVSVTTPYFYYAIKLLKSLRKTKYPIILGGPHASSRPQDLLDYSDQIIRGDGEEMFLQALKEIQAGKKLKKVVLAEQIKDLDQIPPPAREKINLKEYDVPGAMLTSRGCPFNCSFCWKLYKTWVPHSPHRVTTEMGYLVNKNIKHILWWDDNSFLDRKRMYKIIEILEKEKYDIRLRASMRVNFATKKLMSKMSKIGMDYVSFGVESTDPEVLRRCHKGINLDLVRKAVKNAKDAGIYVHLYFVIGLPGSNLEITKRDIEFALSSGADIVCPQPATPYPGTELAEWVNKHANLLIKDWSFYGHGEIEARGAIPFETSDFSKEERLKAVDLWFRAQRKMYNINRMERARNPKKWPEMGCNLGKIMKNKILFKKKKYDIRERE